MTQFFNHAGMRGLGLRRDAGCIKAGEAMSRAPNPAGGAKSGRQRGEVWAPGQLYNNRGSAPPGASVGQEAIPGH